MPQPPEDIVVAECKKCDKRLLMDTITEMKAQEQKEQLLLKGDTDEITEIKIIKRESIAHMNDCMFGERMRINERMIYDKICKFQK